MTRLSFSFPAQGQFLRTLLAALCLGVCVLPAAGQSQRASSAADFIVAVVNSTPITNVELQLRLLRVQQQLSRQGNVPPRSQLVREVLERLILERAQLQLARELGVTPDDAAVDQAVDNVALQNQVSLEELKRRLSVDGVDYARFRADVRDELTLVRLREREVDSRVKVSEQDIDQFFRDRQAQAGAEPERIQLAQILVAVPESATADQVRALQAKAQRALDRVRAGEPFAGVAAEVSDAADRAAGGDLGLRPVDRLPGLFVDAVRDLKDGALAGPLRSGAGFHVLQLVKRSRDAAALTVIQTRARHILFKSGPKFNEAQATAKLLDFKRLIVAGQADFAALARDNSEDGSAKDGGDLGWTSTGMFVPEFEQVMNQLAPGQIADPLVSRFGVHLLQVMARREAPLSEREQRELARNLVREKKIEEAFILWQQEVRGRAYVEFRNEQ
ncbi:MAG: peptidylprolyl isomerase [Polaromonas sp.]|nr:peptidylprolyl isomerase [Polaromonas sp.]